MARKVRQRDPRTAYATDFVGTSGDDTITGTENSDNLRGDPDQPAESGSDQIDGLGGRQISLS